MNSIEAFHLRATAKRHFDAACRPVKTITPEIAAKREEQRLKYAKADALYTKIRNEEQNA